MYNVLTEYHINMIFRMLVSCLCGMAIGFERKNRAKEAGIRTHCIVACASAKMMIISKYGFEDLIQAYTSADVRLDPSRMAQGIVTGVGFLAQEQYMYSVAIYAVLRLRLGYGRPPVSVWR